MRKICSGIITLQEGQSDVEFEEKFNNWILENGWTYRQADPIELPNNRFSAIHGSYIGTAVFHPNYIKNNKSPEINRRYFIRRTWNANLPIMTTFMMNPSLADEVVGDGTIDFMMAYAKYNGYGTLLVVNTSPIIKGSDTGENDFTEDVENWFYIKYAINSADIVVLGWGKNGQKYGIPILLLNYPIIDLFNKNQEKLNVFAYGEINATSIYPRHPHPQKVNQRFSIDDDLHKVTLEERNMLLRS